MKLLLAALITASSLAGVSQAEVIASGPNGFRLRTVQQVAAPPEAVFRAVGEIGRWWSDAHTYSGKAANMTMPLAPNACFCENLPGGGVRHGVVELVIPNRQVRVSAALGPLQDEGVSAALFFGLAPKDGGTELTVTYNVGGARDAMVAAAPVIDSVVSEAARRLKTYIESGKP
jgi:uncharacterized protein YndB with AHSA1/START domain